MKKIFVFLTLAAIFVSACSKPAGKDNNSPEKPNDETPADDTPSDETPATYAITINGDFSDWGALEQGSFWRAVCDPEAPWQGVAEIRCYADPYYVFYYVKFDAESLEEAFDAGNPEMHLRLCLNTDGEFTSGYSNYFLDSYDYILECQFVEEGAYIDLLLGEFSQRIGPDWIPISKDGDGLVAGKGARLEYEISLNRAEFNKRLEDCKDLDADDKHPIGDEFQTGIRFYYDGWEEFSNMPNTSIYEDAGNGWGYLMRMKTNK